MYDCQAILIDLTRVESKMTHQVAQLRADEGLAILRTELISLDTPHQLQVTR
jgi:hypothetical protein